MSVKRSLLCSVMGFILLLTSCTFPARTRSAVYRPECVVSTRVVGLAPIEVEPHALEKCNDAADVVREALLLQSERSAPFALVPLEILTTDAGHPLKTRAALAAAERLGLDGVMFCTLGANKITTSSSESDGYGLSYNSESGLSLEPKTKEVTETNWIGTKLSILIVQVSSGELIAESEFAMPTKFYWLLSPPPEELIAETVEGAFKPIAEGWAQQRVSAESASPQPN